jgi:hypothetical protein
MERTKRYMSVGVVVAAVLIGTLLAQGAPTIKSISPVSGYSGTPFTITGTGFGATKGTSSVTLNGKPLPIASWSDTVIKTGAGQAALGPGKVVVTVNGVASNAVTFTVKIRGK